MASNGEEQDAYILGMDEVVDKFTGTVIAVVHRPGITVQTRRRLFSGFICKYGERL